MVLTYSLFLRIFHDLNHLLFHTMEDSLEDGDMWHSTNCTGIQSGKEIFRALRNEAL